MGWTARRGAQESSDGTLFTLADDDPGADIRRMRKSMPSLEAVERRRFQLWAVAFLMLLAVSGAVALLMTDAGADAIPQNAGVRYGFIGVSVGFMLYVFDQERRLRRLSELLVKERVLSSALESRVRDLATLSRVGQVVNSVLTMEEVLRIVLESAFELTRSVTGSVMIADGDELEVAVSAGADRAPVGARQPIDSGVAGLAATSLEPLLITGRIRGEQVKDARERHRPAASAVCAPMLVGQELVGVLALERAPGAVPFTEWELRSVAVFAANAATAVANARRYENERSNVERLADMLERRSEYVATMVHDLKAPLTAISGYIRLMEQRPEKFTPELRATALGNMRSASDNLLGIIDSILRGASAEATVDVRREEVDVLEALRELAELTARMAEGRDGVGRAVDVVTDGSRPRLVTDAGALRSVILNLLENAVKYSPPGTPVTITLEDRGSEIAIGVTDRGEGIPEDEQATIFERFRQRRPTDAGGVGLGLYIVRSLVRAHGGRLWVQSSPGQGATFWVALPHTTPTQRAPGAPAVGLVEAPADPVAPS